MSSVESSKAYSELPISGDGIQDRGKSGRKDDWWK